MSCCSICRIAHHQKMKSLQSPQEICELSQRLQDHFQPKLVAHRQEQYMQLALSSTGIVDADDADVAAARVRMCVYGCGCGCGCMCACVCVPVCVVCVHVCMHACIKACKNQHRCTHTFRNSRVCRHNACTHIHAHTHTHTHIHTNTHTHVHTHAHIDASVPCSRGGVTATGPLPTPV